jgi:hypothetical protein
MCSFADDMSEAPTFNLQAPENLQAPNAHGRAGAVAGIPVSNLAIFWNLDFGG